MRLFAHPDYEPLFYADEVLAASDITPATSLTADQLFELALLFSECPLESETAVRCIKKFSKIKAEVSSVDFMSQSPEDRGRAVLKLLYRDYLTKYNFDQTKIDVALETGVYNCVSSAMLYMAAAKASGLEVRGQRTSQHAFCSIYVQGTKSNQLQKIDVETTNPYGFNPGSREAIENEENIQKFYVVPKKYYANRQEVSDRVFAGLIAGNICSDCIKSNDYERALPMGAARYEAVRLENSAQQKSTRQEFDILAVNYVNLKVSSAATLSDALNWYTGFIDRWGITDFLQKNMDTAFNNLVVLCSKENDYQFAVDSLEHFRKYLTQKQITKTEEVLADILEKPWLELLNSYMRQRDFTTGLEKADEALVEFPQSTKIKNMRQIFYNNCIAIIHNDFAKLANARNFEEALNILAEGLEKFPDDKTLTKDFNELQKIINQFQ